MDDVVLLVDDDQNILHGLARALRHQPYRLYTATSGDEALLVLKGHEVDGIVSDEQMPGMSGGDLLAWVANHHPEVMRIVLTGQPTVENALRAINESAVYQFFTKPCNPAHLGVAIRKALEHKALRIENRQLLDANKLQIEQLEQYRSDLEILTSLVSHNIQEPLRTISGSCKSLEEQYHDLYAPQARALAESALDGVASVKRLVNQLREHCRSREGWGPARRAGPGDEPAGGLADRPAADGPGALRKAGSAIP